jgi:hypothetical protein
MDSVAAAQRRLSRRCALRASHTSATVTLERFLPGALPAAEYCRYKRISSSRDADASTGVRSDSTIRLRGPKTATLYPDPLRRINYHVADIDRWFVFLTNNFTRPAPTIAQLYKCRWEVEGLLQAAQGPRPAGGAVASADGAGRRAASAGGVDGVCVRVVVAAAPGQARPADEATAGASERPPNQAQAP